MWERTLSESKIKFLMVRSVLKGYVLTKMKRSDKMKCSAVVDRARDRAGRTGTEMLEWRTDRRNLSVLAKKITDIICIPYFLPICLISPSSSCSFICAAVIYYSQQVHTYFIIPVLSCVICILPHLGIPLVLFV